MRCVEERAERVARRASPARRTARPRRRRRWRARPRRATAEARRSRERRGAGPAPRAGARISAASVGASSCAGPSAVATIDMGRPASSARPMMRRGRLAHRVPVGRRGPAIVDHQKQRAGARRLLRGRPVDRPGQRDDQRRRDQAAKEDQPPRGPRRRLFLRRDLEEEPGRRKALGLRLRRGDAKEQPDQRQREQREEDRRVGEGEGKRAHAARPIAEKADCE